PGADEMAQLLLVAIAADRLRRVALEHLVGAGRIEPFAISATGGVDAPREPAGSGKLGEVPRDRDGVRCLVPEIIDEHGHRLIWEDLAEHLGGAHRRAGIADQSVRHRAGALLLSEE